MDDNWYRDYGKLISPISTYSPWASYQTHKIACCACARMPGTFSPPPRVSDPGMQQILRPWINITVWCLIELHPSHVISLAKFNLIWSMEWLHRNNEYLYVSWNKQWLALYFNFLVYASMKPRFDLCYMDLIQISYRQFVKLLGFSLQRNMSFSQLIINQFRWIMYGGLLCCCITHCARHEGNSTIIKAGHR